MELILNNISQKFTHKNGDHLVLRNIHFSVQENEIVSIVGLSGMGKTTLLNLIAGFIKPSSGFITNQFQTGYVFQESALFPWLSIRDNLRIPYSFQHKDITLQEIDSHVTEYLDLVKIASKKDRYPFQLSGGEKQRAAIAQALMMDNHLLLMDEPFANLDCFTRLEMNKLVLSIFAKKNMSGLFVTHNIDEALLLSNRVIILAGSPAEILKTIPIDLTLEEREDSMGIKFINYKKQVLNTLRPLCKEM